MSSGLELAGGAGEGLTHAVLEFARLLRAAGLRVGSGQVALALRALQRIDVTRSEDVYWALHALWISDPRQRVLFEQAFALFWRERRPPPAILQHLRAMPEREQRRTALRRVAEAWASRTAAPAASSAPVTPPEVRWDATLTFSEREQLSRKDFEHMSVEELQLARRWIDRLVLQLTPLPSRRLRPALRGQRLDLSATLRASARTLGDAWPLRFRSRMERSPALLVLCDISGSMERYSRILLHFMHALSTRRLAVDVHSFVFGTRLTPITAALRERDVDVALAQIGSSGQGWTGGTRIGASLHQFNQCWLRRVPARRAIVLLITDGLDRDAGAGITPALQRLRRSCRRLIWLNPLLRDPGFQPLAAGIRAILPEVDEHRPVHDLRSLEALCTALGQALAARARRAGKVGSAQRRDLAHGEPGLRAADGGY